MRPYSTFGSKPRIRRDSERQIKIELTAAVSQITRRATPFCVLCGENNWSKLEAGHYWHRNMPPTEFDLDNLNTLCHSCNQAHESNPGPYRAYMMETLGQEAYDSLAQKAHAQTKIGYVALNDLREEMKAKLAELKAA